jgi:murein DD-endopeptidase MepM/ murein hydrolase activator NlpD
LFKCRAAYVWSLVFAICLAAIPSYRELQIASTPIDNTPIVVPPPPRPEVVENTIQKNTTLVATLVDYNIPVTLANEVADLIQPVFDVRKIRFGNPFRLEKERDGTLRAFQYKIDDERVLKVEKEKDSPAYEARVEKLDLEVRENIVTADIRSSLWESLESQPRGDILVNSLAQMFAWDVDFNTDIQPGDQIRMVVQTQYHEGKFVKYGKIQAAELVNAGRSFHAFLFRDEYYNEKGNTLRRALLASPLQFNPRVTSGFSRARLHPILGNVRSHLAVDFGAPTGAPVVAAANGTITTAGRNGGYGNLVQIRHGNGLTTGYAHLSRFRAGLRPGAVVKQGDVIGYVGATGLATGPHLHYMMTRNGKVINPLSMKAEPPVPIAAALKAEFLEHIAGMQLQLQNVVAAK